MGLFDRFFKHETITKEKPLEKETGWAQDSIFYRLGVKFDRYNPDELVAKTRRWNMTKWKNLLQKGEEL